MLSTIAVPSFQVALLAHIPRKSDKKFSPKFMALTVTSFSESVMAVGTGFGQLFRSVGQVRGAARVSEVFPDSPTWLRSAAWPSRPRSSSRFSIGNFEGESTVLTQMRYPEISTPDDPSHRPSHQIVRGIRESAKLVVSLPPDLQRAARDSYAIALKIVFMMAMCSTLMAYIVRLAVSSTPNRARQSTDSELT